MPFKSKSQQRFMFSQHPEMAKEWADKTPDISKLPEHVKKMADGGQAEADADFNADQQGLQTPPEVLAALTALAGGAGMAEDMPEMLGNETGSISLGGNAPEMEGAAPKIRAYVKAIQKNPNGPDIKLYGVEGSPEDLMREFNDPNPGSVPEHILRQKGLLPDTQIDMGGENAPNGFAFGGETNPKHETVKSMENNPSAGFDEGGEAKPTLGSENPILAKLKEMLGSKPVMSDKSEAAQADAIDPVVTSSDTPKGYAEGGDVSMDDSDALAALLSSGGQDANANAAAALKLYGPSSAQDNMTMTPQGAQMMNMNAPTSPLLPGPAQAATAAQPLSIPPWAHIAPQGAPIMPPQMPPPMGGKTMPPTPGQQPPMPSMQQASQAMQQPDIYAGVSAEDRAKLAQQLLAKQSSGSGLAASGAAGLGDAISNSFGKGGANFQNQVRENMTNKTNAQLGVVDTERTQKMQDLEAHIAVQENDPQSVYSSGMRQFVTAFTGKQVPSGVSAGMLKSAFGDLAKIFDAQLTSAAAISGQKVEAEKAGAAESPWKRLLDYMLGNPAEKALQQTATGGHMTAAQAKTPKYKLPSGGSYSVNP